MDQHRRPVELSTSKLKSIPHGGLGARRRLRPWRCPRAAVLGILTSLPIVAASGGPPAHAVEPLPAASLERQLARIQLHRNSSRGIAYLPRAAGDAAEPASFAMRPTAIVRTDGDPLQNVRSNLYPIDADGDGTFELLQLNGSRFLRVYRQSGRKLWEARNPTGRIHTASLHKDTAAVLDADGDGRQEIVHCWVVPGSKVKRLVIRRGDTGAVVRSRALAGDSPGGACLIAAFRVPGQAEPLILVARDVRPAAGEPACPRPFVDTWAVTAAFDLGLRPLWQRSTCDAGHHVWPLDEDGDGLAEAFFVGKYLLRPDGSLRCLLPGWGDDHVDSLVAGELDATRPGYEALAIGISGARAYATRGCAPLPATFASLRNGQHMAAARVDRNRVAATVFVRLRNGDAPATKVQPVIQVDAAGRVISRFVDDNSSPYSTGRMPMVNANLDGAAAVDDVVTWFGQVITGGGRLRLGTGWYWNLQPLAADERGLPAYELWSNTPVIVDLDGDGRDEMITWGRRNIVVGTRAG